MQLPLDNRENALKGAFETFGDISIDNEDWKRRFEKLGWPLSDSPFSLSKTLRAYDAQKDSPLSHYFLPSKADLRFDREIHGERFTQYLLDLFGNAPEAPRRKGWEDITHAPRHLDQLLERLADRGVPDRSALPDWKDEPLAKLAIMDFLAILQEATNFDAEAINALSGQATAWIERKKRNANALKGFDMAAASHGELAEHLRNKG